MSGNVQLDPSIITQGAQANATNAVNPLLVATQATALRNSRTNLLLNQSKLSAGADYQKSINPATGLPDQVKLGGLLANDGAAAGSAQSVIGDNQVTQGQAVSNANASLDQHLKIMTAVSNEAQQLATSPTASLSEARAGVQRLVDAGILPAAAAAQQLTDGPAMDTPQAWQAWGKAHAAQSMGVIDQITAMQAHPGLVSTPGGEVVINTNPNSANPTVPGTVITPGSAPTTPVYNPQTQSMDYSGGSPPQIIPPGAAQAPTSPTALGGGTFPAPGPQGAQGAPSTLAGAPAAAPLGQDQYASQSAGAFAQFQQQASTAPTRIYTLQKALTGLQSSNTGPGSDERNTVLSYVQSLAGQNAIPGISPDSIKSYDEANKYLTAYAQQSAGSFGPSTDSQLATALSANASTHISNLAAQDVVRSNIALERMNQVAGQIASSQGVTPGNFLQWKTQFGATVDPRAFALPDMPPADAQALVKSLGSKDSPAYIKFANTFALASKYGAIQAAQSDAGK